jgi:acetyl-CoA carboxylase carboxyl transferase subunit alpha
VTPRRGGRFVRRLAHRLGGGTPDSASAVWETVQLARHQDRPYPLDYIQRLAPRFEELHGDRLYGDDPAIVAGIGRYRDEPVAIIGHQKGRDARDRAYRNFGMPGPEGYRKAMRVMELAERFGLPVVTFVDVPGAHPGPESEERGIAEAIARSIGLMSRLRTPIVVVITGEGGSGGALAIAVGDVIIALENAVYSVISPEGCAAILWRTADEAAAAAVAMRMTAPEQAALGVVDLVVPEPGEGAHTDVAETARRIRDIVVAQLDLLSDVPLDALVEARYRRFRTLGTYREVEAPMPPAPERPGLADRLRNLLDSGRWSGIATSPTGRHDEPPARDEV